MLYHKKFRKTTVTTSFGDIEIDEKGFSNCDRRICKK